METEPSLTHSSDIPLIENYDIPDGIAYEPVTRGQQHEEDEESKKKKQKNSKKKVELLGLGNFGCVVQVKLSKESSARYENEKYIAIKYVLSEDLKHPKEDFEKELLISKQISDYRLRLGEMKLFVKVFKLGITNGSTIRNEWFERMKRICTDITGLMIRSNYTMYMYVLEMETCFPGNVWNYVLNTYTKERTLLSTEVIRNITFQICYAMEKYQKDLGLKHFDIKPSNILLKKLDEGVVGLDSLFPYEVKIADFGRSNTRKYPARPDVGISTPNWLVAPVEWIFFFDKKKSHGADDFDLDTDLWSLGLFIVHIALVGMDIAPFCHFLPLAYNDYTVYSMPHILSLIEYHEDFLSILPSIIEDAGDTRDESVINPKLELLLCICQFQKYLGNGFLPIGTSFETDSNYYKAISASEELILDSCRIRKIHEDEEEEEEDPEDQTELCNIEEGNPNVFYLIVNYLRDRLGEDGLDFVRKCLQWTTSNRYVFDHRVFNDSKQVLFGACLLDPFLIEYTKGTSHRPLFNQVQ